MKRTTGGRTASADGAPESAAPPGRLLDDLRAAVERDGGIGAYRGSRAEGIAAYLDTFFTEQQAPAGALVGTKPELAAVFGVAPSTLNEAMQILASRERVKLRQGPNGGVFVAAPRPVLRLAHSLVQLTDGGQDVSEAVEVRDALEPAVALNALRNRRPEHLAALRARVDEIEQSSDSSGLYRTILAFHATLAEACANELLRVVYLTALETVRSRARGLTVIRTSAADPAPAALRRRRMAVHRAIFAAIEAQDEAALRRALKVHAEYQSHH